jgi:hypothetical protein
MKFLFGLSFAFAVACFVLIKSNEAYASASGCDNRQYSGEPADPKAITADIKLPFGYLCHLVHTRGKDISEQKAAYTSAAGIYSPLVADICDWRIDFVYYDTKGNEYKRDKGETVSDCKGASRENVTLNKLPHYGTTCAELILKGETRFTQCHGITE